MLQPRSKVRIRRTSHNVWLAWQVGAVQPESVAHAMQQPPHGNFRTSIFGPHTPHNFRSVWRRKRIHRARPVRLWRSSVHPSNYRDFKLELAWRLGRKKRRRRAIVDLHPFPGRHSLFSFNSGSRQLRKVPSPSRESDAVLAAPRTAAVTLILLCSSVHSSPFRHVRAAVDLAGMEKST